MQQQKPSGHHEKTPSTLADLLKSRRQAGGLTRTAIAQRLGISRSQYTRLETGEAKRPSPALLGRMGELLNVSVGDLYAITGYIPLTELPSFGAYLRALHPDWPDPVIAMLDDFHDFLRYKYSLS